MKEFTRSCPKCGKTIGYGRKWSKDRAEREQCKCNSCANTNEPLPEYFSNRVEKRANGCWHWIGTLDNTGYGVFQHCWKRHMAHRVSWELHNGPIPEGMFVCHTCDNRRCVNPNHLFLGTLADNSCDMVNKRRQAYGEKNSSAKLTEAQVIEIRQSGENVIALAKRFNVGRSSIYRVRLHKTWKHIP